MNEWATWVALLAMAGALMVVSRELRDMRAGLERAGVERVWLRGDIDRAMTLIDLRRQADSYLSADLVELLERLEALEGLEDPPIWKHEGHPGPVVRNIQAKEER